MQAKQPAAHGGFFASNVTATFAPPEEAMPENPLAKPNAGHRVMENTGPDTDLWTNITKTVKDWSDYVDRARAHLETNREKHSPDEHSKTEQMLTDHLQLANIFKEKVTPVHAGDFLAVQRGDHSGPLGALAVRRPAGKSVFLDDLWSDPRKAYQITDDDKIKGHDASGAAALAHVIREAHGRGGDVKLTGGNRKAREYYHGVGFGVMAHPPNKPHGTRGPTTGTRRLK